MSAWSLKNTLAFRIDYNFRTVLKLLHYCSINVNCCIRTCEHFILTTKENCQTDNYGKFGKKLLVELCSFFIDILAFELGKLCQRMGILFRFFRPGGRSFALKSCPRGGDFAGKKLVARGEMVTGQTDTCITSFIIVPRHIGSLQLS